MDFYLGLAQVIGIHTLLGLSAWCVLHTGQVSLAQGGFFAIGAYGAGILTAMFGWPLALALPAAAAVSAAAALAVGVPALRVKGLMLVVATTAFAEIVRLGLFNLHWRVQTPAGPIGPDGQPPEYYLGPLQAGCYLGAVALVLAAVGAVLFAKRDLH